MHWDRPEQQARTVEVPHSTERPGLTAVFGTTVALGVGVYAWSPTARRR